jgi:transcriptional regulator with XRE-family HTH domain
MRQTPPFAVEHAAKQLGEHIRIARLRRNLTLKALAEKIGVHRNTVALVEAGKPGVSLSVLLSVLWALDMLDHVLDVASPTSDVVGQRHEFANMRQRARSRTALDNDF